MDFIARFSDLISLWQPAVYLVGLLAVAALGFRAAAGRAIPVLLSFLWLWTAAALAAVPAHPVLGRFAPWVAGLFALQGLLLLIRAFYKPLATPPPVGMSRLWGGLLIGYALVVYPILREWGPLQDADLEPPVPFSLVPLTLGLLLFLRPVPRYLLALPIAWAACGGAAAVNAEAVLDPGLTVAFLVGIIPTLPRRLPFTDTSGDLRDETWPAYAARTRRSFGRTLLLLLLATAFLAFLSVWSVPSIRLAARWLLFHAAIAGGLGLGYWLWLPGWMGPGFRHLAWAAASLLRRAGAVWRWSLSLWPAWLLVCVLALLGASFLYKQASQPRMETSLLVAAGVVVLLALPYLVYRARRQLVILEFNDYTKEKGLEECVKGLAARLRNELAGTSALFRTIDEAMPTPTGQVIPVKIGVEDPLEALGDVVGPDAKFQIWKIEVPVGFLFRWVGRLVGGPRLTGSLHREGDEIVLVADYAGGGQSASWRVIAEEIPEEERGDSSTALVNRMVENLGYRVVTALGNIGSQRWEAVRHYTRGLRSYRSTQLSTQDPAPDLRQAEREFIQAMEFDRTFAQCHYNLGVVYRGLQHLEAAEASFRQILEEDPEWKEAYYALANTYFDQKSYRRAALYARRAIDALPFDARAWNVSGIARHWQLDTPCASAALLPAQQAEIIEDFEIATALAWRSLFKSALCKEISGTLRIERYMASRCSTNLSIVRANFVAPGKERREALGQALQASREACRLSPRTALFSLIRGEVLYDADRLPEARTALFDAFGDALPGSEQLQRWMYLLGVQQGPPADGAPDLGPDARSIYRGFLDYTVPPEEIMLDMSAAGSNPTRQHREYAKFLDGALAILQEFPVKQVWIEPYMARWRQAVHFLKKLELEGTAQPLGAGQETWSQAQIDLRLIRGRLSQKPAQAGMHLTQVIETLEREGHGRQVRRQGLYGLQARAYLLHARQEQGRARRDLLIAALRDAEHSVSQEPESPGRRWILAEVHGALNDLDQATFERRIALRLHQGSRFLENAASIGSIAQDYLSGSRIDTPNDTVLRQGLSFLQQILRHLESKSLDRDEPERRFEAHAAAHYWIGRFHLALGDWRAATCSLKIACAMGFTSLDGFLRLGVAYFGAGTYDDAEKVFREAVTLHSEIARPVRAVFHSPPEPFAELLLSWAMTCAEQGARLRLASCLVRKVERRCLPAAAGMRRRELKALHHECLGRIRFRQQRYKASINEVQKALGILETARSYTLLAEVYRTAAARGAIEASIAQTRAQAAQERAERIYRNGAGGLIGVWNLLQSPTEQNGRCDTLQLLAPGKAEHLPS